MRKICILELFSIKMVESFRVIREEEVLLMIQKIAGSLSSPIDMRKAMVSLANNIICRVALGKKYEKSRLHGILEETETLFGSFFVADFFPALAWIDKLTGIEGCLNRNTRELDAFYEEVIKDHVDQERIRDEHEDIVDVLLRLQKDGSFITKDNIKAVLTDVFIAGTETSAATLVWAMAELIRNPKAMKKAQEEVRSLVGLKGKVDEGELHQLRYLKAVVKETLRLHSPVPVLLPREAMQQCKIGGYDILPNTRIFINAWGIGRDPRTWDDGEEFIPERFVDSPIDFKGHDFQFIPFGSGRRICPAMNTGILMIELALANMLCLFDWELPTGVRKEDVDMNDAPGITVHKRSVLHLLAVNHVKE